MKKDSNSCLESQETFSIFIFQMFYIDIILKHGQKLQIIAQRILL